MRPVVPFVLLASLGLVSAVASAQDHTDTVTAAEPSFSISGPQLYPLPVLPQFTLGDLTWDGCSPIYLEVKGEFGCPMFRGEPATLGFQVGWRGPGLLTLFPVEGSFFALRLRDGVGHDEAIEAPMRIVEAQESAKRTDGAIELTENAGVRLQLDLSGLTASLPAGRHTICYDLTFFSDPAVARPELGNPCVSFTLYETRTRRTVAERLRREAVNLLADFRCDEAAPVIEELLRVHPTSAAAFRLKGIIAELRRHDSEALDLYATAIALMRPDGDTLLVRTGNDFRGSAESLDDWRRGMEPLVLFAPDLSLLGPVEDGMTCRPQH
jgi:hypothetical protein